MMRLYFKLILIGMVIPNAILFAQEKENLKDVSKALEKVFDDDQNNRELPNIILKKFGATSKEYQYAIEKQHAEDSTNQKIVFTILDKYGWPSKNKISAKASNAIFYVIQHAGLEAGIKYAEMVKNASKNNQIGSYEYTIFIDRQKMFQGKNQIYGTQLGMDNIGNMFLYPVEDIDSIDFKRKSMGLELIEEYLKKSKVRYFDFPLKKNKDDVLLIGHMWDEKNKGVKDVSVFLDSCIVGKSDENGFFFINICKPYNKTIDLFIKRMDDSKTYKYTLTGEKDFFEIRRGFK